MLSVLFMLSKVTSGWLCLPALNFRYISDHYFYKFILAENI